LTAEILVRDGEHETRQRSSATAAPGADNTTFAAYAAANATKNTARSFLNLTRCSSIRLPLAHAPFV